ncbi:hypothetical protein [Solidesulfovibrio carbinolicus]|uniref:Uncharacterized protein n=1 Tax=Solidesulfovibrio carbinolicus TaxID=296842 RepID=A0A4P6I1V3_9BACT|nr:hypothetical protein [Solidesulfovibrio carbinolicus]QAZ67779.1 hypothetical protein C3Y92_11325 [Solidesulfovibrio carbinolicus]
MAYPALTNDAALSPRPCAPLPEMESDKPLDQHRERTCAPRRANAAPGLSVTRLGPGRWRISARLPEAGQEDLDIYLAPSEGSAVRLLAPDDDVCRVSVEGTLGEAGAANLGDCLLEALERGPARLDVVIGPTVAEASLGVAAVLESFGRVTARLEGRPEIAVNGPGQGCAAMRQAFDRGAAKGRASLGAQGGQP